MSNTLSLKKTNIISHRVISIGSGESIDQIGYSDGLRDTASDSVAGWARVDPDWGGQVPVHGQGHHSIGCPGRVTAINGLHKDL